VEDHRVGWQFSKQTRVTNQPSNRAHPPLLQATTCERKVRVYDLQTGEQRESLD